MATISNGLLLLCLALLVATMAAATQFKVGGTTMGWTVPTDPNAMSYNRWAENNRFSVGDSLLFVYQPGDSVLQVSQDAYHTCNTSSFIGKYDDGNTVFAFDRSGPYYFISGVENNCLRNESLLVVVLADHSNRSSGSNPTPTMTPSPSPSSEVTPSTSPADGSGGKSENGGSLKVVGFMGTISTLLASLIVL